MYQFHSLKSIAASETTEIIDEESLLRPGEFNLSSIYYDSTYSSIRIMLAREVYT
jgi:hypothetical protein